MKTNKKCLLTIIIFIVFFICPGEKNHLFNYTDFSNYNGFNISFSIIEKIIEPYFGLVRFLGAIPYWQNFLYLSFLWTVILSILYTIFKKKNIFPVVLKNIFLFIIFVSTVIFSFTFPVKIKKNINLFLMDAQSHTYYSWDGMYSPEYNQKWHKRNGYDFNYITDHWNFDAKKYLTKSPDLSINKFSNLFFGMETALNGDYFLINEEVNSYQNFINIIDSGKAISLFYWNNKNLKNFLIKKYYGYEIYNSGHPQFDPSKKIDFLNEIKSKKIKLYAGTDWHGYLSFSWCWTVIETENESLSLKDIDKIIYSFEDNNYRITNRVVLYGKTILHKLKPSYFEPFRTLFIYFTGLDIRGILSWYFFICILMLLKNKNLLLLIFNFLIFIWLIRLFYLGIVFRNNYMIVTGKNQVLNDLSSFLLIFSGIFIFYFISKIFDNIYRRSIKNHE